VERVKKLTIQIIRRHQQFQAQLGGHVNVRYVLGVLVLFVVVEVLAYFLEHEAAVLLLVDGLESTSFFCSASQPAQPNDRMH
jgi:hypothetical protein